MDKSPRNIRQALSPTGGFLTGFSHTLNPYIGCAFTCEYCYVKALPVHVFHSPKLSWGEYVHPKENIADQLLSELLNYKKKGELDDVKIFMSSATDPYQGLERTYKLTQKCLLVMCRVTPKLLVVQTRSPLVARDFGIIQQINDKRSNESSVWLNMTIETDLEYVRKNITPKCPSLQQRTQTVKQAVALGIPTQITISPCLPYSSPDRFARFLKETGVQRILIDTFTSGDGTSSKYTPGLRTSKTHIPELYEELGYGDWRSEYHAKQLYNALLEHFPNQVGWSNDGFTRAVQEA